MKIPLLQKKLFVLIVIISSSYLSLNSVSGQILTDHSYFKINGDVVDSKYEIPNIQTRTKANFIYDKTLEVGDNIAISINKAALGSRFSDPDIRILTKIKADFNFKISSPDNPQEIELVGQSEYTFVTNEFDFKFNNTGSYQLELILIKSNGVVLTSESYLVNVGSPELAPDIKINNILQSTDVLELQGNEKLSFDSNFSEEEYDFVWGNNRDVLAQSKIFNIDLEKQSTKPDYIVLRAVNKYTGVFAENYIRFDYSNSNVYVVEPERSGDESIYDVSPPEIIPEANPNTIVLLSLAGLALLVSILTFVMFRLIKSAKINS